MLYYPDDRGIDRCKVFVIMSDRNAKSSSETKGSGARVSGSYHLSETIQNTYSIHTSQINNLSITPRTSFGVKSKKGSNAFLLISLSNNIPLSIFGSIIFFMFVIELSIRAREKKKRNGHWVCEFLQ